MSSARIALIAAAGILLVVSDVSACAVCYGDPNSAMVKGANNGILVLLAITVFVQLAFVALFWSLWRRAKKRREQFRLLEGGAR